MKQNKTVKKKFIWENIINLDQWIAYYNKEKLGTIFFYPNWKKYVWEQDSDIIMSISCLKKVVKKLEELK